MAIIPGGQQIRTTSSDVDLTNRGNSLVQSQNQVYTMDDIVETVNAESAGSGESYLVYTGYFTQFDVNNPVVTTLKNTTGGSIITTRFGAGEYEFALNAPTGIQGTPWLVINNGSGYGSGVKLITSETTTSSGNCTGFLLAVTRDSDGSASDLNNEKIYFELRLYS
jgi:hypothetical protein